MYIYASYICEHTHDADPVANMYTCYIVYTLMPLTRRQSVRRSRRLAVHQNEINEAGPVDYKQGIPHRVMEAGVWAEGVPQGTSVLRDLLSPCALASPPYAVCHAHCWTGAGVVVVG